MSDLSMGIARGYRLAQRLELVFLGVTIVCISQVLEGCVGPDTPEAAMTMDFEHIGAGWCGFNSTAFSVCREFSKDTKELCERECVVRHECGAYTFTEGLSFPNNNCFIHSGFDTDFSVTEAVSVPDDRHDLIPGFDTTTNLCYRKDLEAFEKNKPTYFPHCILR